MRLSDLLGSPVRDADGATLGRVQDVLLVQDAPYVEGFGHGFRVEGILTGTGTLAVRLGFGRAGVRGPWPLTTLFRALERRARYYRWADVERWDDRGVTLRPGASATAPE
jgi:hypothetical protein